MEKDPNVQAEIFRILNKKQEERSDTEWQALYNYTSSINFFQKYVVSGYKNIPQECCKVLQPLQMKKGDIVFYINTEGNKFYIILQGEVGLFTKKVEEGPGNKFDNLVQVKTLQDGDYFGELGLLNFKMRSATVQCLTDCYFGVIDKLSFDKILKSLEQDILQEKINAFASENAVMRFSSKHTIKQLYFNAIFKKYSPNEFVIISGDPIEAMYIIKSGQYKLVKEYNRKGIMNENDQIDEEHEQMEYSVLNQDKYFLQLQKQKKKLISILDLGSGQLFGYEDFLMKQNYNSYGIVCKEAGEVVMIRGNDFRKRLMQDKLTMIYLKQQMSLQMSYILEREASIVRSMEGYTQFYFEQEPHKDKNELMSKMCKNTTGIKLDIPQTVIQKARAQAMEDKKQKTDKVHSKLSHFKDELSQDFKSNLVKNYQDRFGNMDMTKLKGHVPQEIVQQVNQKLKYKYKLGTEKSPPQQSSSVLDYVKLKQGNASSFIQSLTTNASSKNLNTIVMTDFSSPLMISTAKIENRNQSNSPSPTLNYISSPLQSAKYISHPQLPDSPIKLASSKRTLFFSSKPIQSGKSLNPSTQEIDEELNGISSENESEENTPSPNKSSRKIRYNSEIIMFQNNYADSNESLDTAKLAGKQGKQDMIGHQQTNKSTEQDYSKSKKVNSFHLGESQTSNKSQIKLMNFFGQQDSNSEQKQSYIRPQKYQIFDSMELKSRMERKKKQGTSKFINSSVSTSSLNKNSVDNQNVNNKRNIQINVEEANKNDSKQVYLSQSSESPKISNFQNTIQQTTLAIQTPNSKQQSVTQNFEEGEQIDMIGKAQLTQGNSNKVHINVLSPCLTPQSNSTIVSKIQFQHSDSLDSNKSANTQKSQAKNIANYSSLFKPYTPNQMRKISSVFSQIETPKSKENLESSTEKEQKYILTSNTIKKQQQQQLQTTTTSSLGQSRFYNQQDHVEKEGDMSSNSVLSPCNSQSQTQPTIQNFMFDNHRNSNNTYMSDTINENSNMQNTIHTSKSQDDLLGKQSLLHMKNFHFNSGNYPYIISSSKKRDSGTSLPINEIVEQPLYEQNCDSLESTNKHQSQAYKRQKSGSPSKKTEQINTLSRFSMCDITKNDTLEEVNSKSPSNLIQEMLSSISNLNFTKSKSDSKFMYKCPAGRKLTKQSSKPIYKFEQMAVEDKNKKQQKKQQISNTIPLQFQEYGNSQGFLQSQRTISQTQIQKSNSFFMQPKQYFQNSAQKLLPSNSLQLRQSDLIQLDNSLSPNNNNHSPFQLASPKLVSPQLINKSSDYIKHKRPLSSVVYKNTTQKQQFQPASSAPKKKNLTRPSSAKPIDFFQKILEKKME